MDVDVGVDVQRARLVVSVTDAGAGLPDDFDLDATDSLGLRIVLTMVRDRGGDVTLSRLDTGTQARLDVPLA